MPFANRRATISPVSAGTITRRQLLRSAAAALVAAGTDPRAAWPADSVALPGENDWPWWRGPQYNGHATGESPPLDWSAARHVVWKTEIPGRGHATPCLCGDQIFIATADEERQTQSLLALARADGRTLWQRQLHAGGFREKHEKNSHASATPACDGQRVFTVFTHSDEAWVSAVNRAGEIVWQKQVGTYNDGYGYGSSPAIYGPAVIVAGDSPGEGFIAALDRETGKELWRTARPKMTSYGAPLVARLDGRPQIVVQGNQVAGYDPDTGRELWHHAAPAKATACSLIFDEHHVYASGGYPERRIYALRTAGEGELPASHLVWKFEQKSAVAYVPSPLLAGRRLFVVSDGGLATCLDTTTGRTLWNERLGGNFSASPVLSGQHLIAASEEGRVLVLHAGDEFRLLADTKLPDGIFASPVVCGGRLYVRTTRHVYCVGRE